MLIEKSTCHLFGQQGIVSFSVHEQCAPLYHVRGSGKSYFLQMYKLTSETAGEKWEFSPTKVGPQFMGGISHLKSFSPERQQKIKKIFAKKYLIKILTQKQLQQSV